MVPISLYYNDQLSEVEARDVAAVAAGPFNLRGYIEARPLSENTLPDPEQMRGEFAILLGLPATVTEIVQMKKHAVRVLHVSEACSEALQAMWPHLQAVAYREVEATGPYRFVMRRPAAGRFMAWFRREGMPRVTLIPGARYRFAALW